MIRSIVNVRDLGGYTVQGGGKVRKKKSVL